jgi:ribonuclease HIII
VSALGQPTYVGLSPAEVERLARELQSTAWVRKLPAKNPYELLRGEADGAHFVLWRSGKMSYQGPKARELLEELVRSSGILPEQGPPEAGSDEAGKGEWLGPMVVAAVAIRGPQRLALRLDGVRDSKELSPEVRSLLAERIRAHCAAWNVVSIGPRRFNELWDEMHARGETLNDLLWWAHGKALEPVLPKVGGEQGLHVILDEFDRTRHASSQFRAILPQGAVAEQRPRAEDSIAVAAASVLARAERDRSVAELRARHGLPDDLTPERARGHPLAREFAKVAYLQPKA